MQITEWRPFLSKSGYSVTKGKNFSGRPLAGPCEILKKLVDQSNGPFSPCAKPQFTEALLLCIRSLPCAAKRLAIEHHWT